jgi:hypothetical protein
MKPKLSELASLAEVIGAIAVVISLVYVGAQARDTTRAVRSAAINDAREGSLDETNAASLTAGIQATRNTPGMRRFWSERRPYFDPDFAEIVDQVLAMPESPLDNMGVYQPSAVGQ